MEQNPNSRPALRSILSLSRVLVRFVNITERTVRLVWIDFEGRPVTYKDLESRQALDVTTYETHPWMAYDVNTFDKMHINKTFIFIPKSWKDRVGGVIFQSGYIPDDFEPRILIRITLPLYNLKSIALKVIRDLLLIPDDVSKLELPTNLAEQVTKILQHKLSYSRQNPLLPNNIIEET